MNWLSKFFHKINPFKGKPVYVKYPMGSNIITSDQEKLIAKNRKLLLDNQVPINKIRFVFSPTFTYDVDKNIINPKYDVMLPVDVNGKLVKDAPVVEVNKPHTMVLVGVSSYYAIDNFAFIKTMLKNSKKGLVIFLEDGIFLEYGTHDDYGVDTEVLRIANLDDAVEYMKSQDLL